MGTKSTTRYSTGNTLPFTQNPWAMAGFVPQTSSERSTWFYHPDDRGIEGIRLSHQPSPWIRDYGNIVMMPQSGAPFMHYHERWSGFKPEDAVLMPDYINVEFLRYRTRMELTPTTRGAKIKCTFHSQEQPRFGLFPVKDDFHCEVVDAANGIIKGYTNSINYKHADNYAMYFVFKFDCSIEMDVNNEHGASFLLHCGDTAEADLAISFINHEQALLNMQRELSGKTFDQVRNDCAQTWEGLLNKIDIETPDEGIKKTFYSCMYRAFLFPHAFHEYDADNQPMHFSMHDGKVRPGILYTDCGFWDTFRTLYPLYAIILPEKYAELVEGFINFYKDCGWLPKWPCPGEVGAMPGTLIDAVLADAAVKGIIKGNLSEDALEAMIKHAETDAGKSPHGRKGVDDYRRLGYIPNDKYGESVNHSLDYAYGDWCIAQVAKVLGKHDLAKKYHDLSMNYKTLFDKTSGFLRGKDAHGNLSDNFNPIRWGGEYCEGGPWQTSFGMHHDFEGMIELYGGKAGFLAKMEELFNTPPHYDVGSYRHEIHEMTEMASQNFGQCAISNQPSFHLPWLFAIAGDSAKTDYWVEKILREGFTPDTFPGDEDNGSLSSWYILASLGMYAVSPGTTEYVRNKPLVDKAVIYAPTGDIVVDKNKTYTDTIIHYAQIMDNKLYE